MKSKRFWPAIALATFVLMVNFWIWSLLSPIASRYADLLSLDPLHVSLLVSSPVIIGSLGRVALGSLTDRFGARKMFMASTLILIPVTFYLSTAKTYGNLLSAGFLLGVGGATFAIGAPFVNAWSPKCRRGLALGIFGMGNLGVAISGFMTPRLVSKVGLDRAYIIMGGLMIALLLTIYFFLHDSPSWRPSKKPAVTQIAIALRSPATLPLSVVYMLTFGAFVAFGVYLPTLLKNTYGLDATDAAARAAGFILVATLLRPIGGWLSDIFGGRRVLSLALPLVSLLAIYVAFQPPMGAAAAAGYLTMAGALGIGNGAVFQLLSSFTPQRLMGSATGIVGSLGSLGGLLPPIVMGGAYQRTHSYLIALLFLAVFAAWLAIYIDKSSLKTAPGEA